MSSSLIMPKPALVESKKGLDLYPVDTPIPAGLPEPSLWRLYVMPVGIVKQTKGSIFLPDDMVDAQMWNHRLCKIAAVGKQVFRGAAYKALDVAEADIPKVGDLYLYNPKTPHRIGFKGLTFVLVNDDQLEAKITDPETVSSLRFYGFELT